MVPTGEISFAIYHGVYAIQTVQFTIIQNSCGGRVAHGITTLNTVIGNLFFQKRMDVLLP